ncbi:very short patch repair endonuclease [Bradyrhizobium sp. GCM10028915]|uniref:very short patch repair endonuclease n=1 Tax=Bradyrhizobium sp. GCM10028915 TaxID=3273385 RepID=UPI003614C31A
MMSGIRGKNTRPELILRKLLHARGFRYRLHANLPGKPDLVFPKHKAVLFVHGCFWHRHECSIFKWPVTRVEFWRTKINGNFERDQRNVQKLLGQGWRVGVVWECATRDRKRLDTIANKCGAWLNSKRDQLEIE